MDAQSIHARLTRLEEQIMTGSFVAAVPAQLPVEVKKEEIVTTEPIQEQVASPALEEVTPGEEIPEPVGFWAELVASIRQEMKPPYVGFFTATEDAPVQGNLRGNQVVLRCTNAFTLEMVNKPEILDLVARKASALLSRPVKVTVEDGSKKPQSNSGLDRLLDFGRAHSDIVNIKDN